jgi:hypothetical protein
MTLAIPHTTGCATCTRPMVPQRVWLGMDPADRNRLKALGMRNTGGRGKCITCYRAEARIAQTPGKCSRCSIPAVLTAGLCPDCVLVATDLQEAERWAS